MKQSFFVTEKGFDKGVRIYKKKENGNYLYKFEDKKVIWHSGIKEVKEHDI